MLPTFREHPLEGDTEILPLVAFFQHVARYEEEDTAPSALVFLLLGLGGAAGCLVMFNGIWRNRFRGVRRRLVEGSSS